MYKRKILKIKTLAKKVLISVTKKKKKKTRLERNSMFKILRDTKKKKNKLGRRRGKGENKQDGKNDRHKHYTGKSGIN